MLPTCRVPTRMTGIKSTGWRPFTDGGFKRNVEGTDAAGWGIAPVSRANAINILCGPVICDPRHPAFSGARTCSNSTAELTGVAEAPMVLPSVANVYVFCMSPSTLREWLWVWLTPQRTSIWPTDAMIFCYAPRTRFSFPCTMSMVTPATLETSVRTLLCLSAPVGLSPSVTLRRGRVTRQFQVQELSQENRRLSHVEECLHEARSRWQLA